MPRYAYVAQDAQGIQVSGAIGAANRRDALGMLIKRNLTPVRLREDNDSGADRRKVRLGEVESFFEMLSDLLVSGMPLSKAMDVLCQRTTGIALRKVAESIRDDVIDGTALADAMGKHPHVFRPITLSLIRAGEQSGFLEESLDQLAGLTRREQELRGRVLGALAYPAFLLAVGVLVMLGMMIFFVPKFEPLFARMAASGELPWATSLLLATSDFLRNNTMVVLAAMTGIFVLCLTATDRTSRQRFFSSIQFRLPLVGPIMVDLAIARFARIMGTMLRGGVPIVDALEVARHSMGDRQLAQAVQNASKNVQAGGAMTEPLRECGLFPIELTEIISIGEKSNRLEKVLLTMAEKLETKTQRRLDTLVKLIEPAMMVVMACMVGFLIVALLLPVFNSAGRFY